MSGIEIAGLAFGVLPVIIETVKAYSTLSARFHTFRYYSKEVKSIRIQLKVHHGIFLNECRLLLRLVENEQGAKDMLEDELDERWANAELNLQLNKVLKDNLGLCSTIIEASKEILGLMNTEMRNFDVLLGHKSEGESVKASIRRLRSAVKLTFDKSKYEKWLDSLRDRNSELAQLRAHLDAFQPHRSCMGGTCVKKRELPSKIPSIRTASRKLHEALSGAWCCGDTQHGEHYAKLCLDADVQTEVRLDLAISCHGPQKETRVIKEPPIWLYVQSISIDTATCAVTTPKSLTKSHASPDQEVFSYPPKNLKKKASSDLLHTIAYRPKNKKRVHFSDATSTPEDKYSDQVLPNTVSGAIVRTVAQQSTSWIDLCKTKNFCHYLKQNLQICGRSSARHCLGYLESPQLYRHMFYLQDRRLAESSQISRDSGHTNLFSIFDIMRQDVADVLTVSDQLKLAHKATMAILQFNKTPWLSERWRLQDFNYFGAQPTLDEKSLKTLHLSSRISDPNLADTSTMERIESTDDEIVDEDYTGINNSTLFFLGIALLEIGLWKPLESQMKPTDPNEIVAARRLARGHTKLGLRYKELTNKCLRCDFGIGNDLDREELQAAVYTDVVCPLENMIKSLSLD